MTNPAPSSTFREISKCRISGSSNLVSVLNLGHQALTGVFPKRGADPVPEGPLELVWCPESGLLQLKHSFLPTDLYGENYGYRSGLNESMVDHLSSKILGLENLVHLNDGDVVLDIGSNDGTSLGAYTNKKLRRIGIDPTGEKFKSFYQDGIELIADFFSADAFKKLCPRQAKIVTSISMFYDLEDPIGFARQVASILADDGVWHLEQSYMPSMLRSTSYDTVCHEHLEYYSLATLIKILDAADLVPIQVITNAVNGGSFAVTACKRSSVQFKKDASVIDWMLDQEDRMGLTTPRPFREFEERVFRHRQDLIRLIKSLRADGKTILGYGASTKGNVLLQFCGLNAQDIPAIADVNEYKFGRLTPGTQIPIISESEARAIKPDYFLVLPWHFKSGIVHREKLFLQNGGRMIFPLPEIEII
jgi:hypothetical protein